MTRGSVWEYVAAIRERYRKAGRREKGRMLEAFTQVTGYHRKAAIRLLRREPAPSRRGRRGRPRRYGPEVAGALRVLWEAADRICARRLQPFLPELMRVLERQGELVVPPAVRVRLCQVSAATVDRLLRPSPEGLRPFRRRQKRRPLRLRSGQALEHHQAGESAEGQDSPAHLRRLGGRPSRLPGGGPFG